MADVEFVYNHDIDGFHRRINRFLEEIVGGESGSSQMNQYDQQRLRSYIGSMRAYHDWVMRQSPLDLPETHPKQYTLKENPTLPDIENESAVDVCHMLELARDELVHSQSARLASGLNEFDSQRILATIGKIENFLESYIASVTPLDLPESSPLAGQTPPGRTGV